MRPIFKPKPGSISQLFPRFFLSFSSQPSTISTTDPEFKTFITEEELSKNEQLKEKLHKFEREWKRLYEEKRQIDYSKTIDHLNEHQKKKVEFLVKHTQKLNLQERQYFAIKIRDQILKTTGLNPLKVNANWPQFQSLGSSFVEKLK